MSTQRPRPPQAAYGPPTAAGIRRPPQNPSTSTSTSTTSSSPNLPSRLQIPEPFAPLRARYDLSPETLGHILTLPEKPAQRSILQNVSQAGELSRFGVLAEERAFFKAVNASRAIRWPVPSTSPNQPWEKVFLLTQISLSGAEFPNKLSKGRRKELMAEKKAMFLVVDRVLRCAVDVMGVRRDATGLREGLAILRSLEAGVWDEEGKEVLQVRGVGPKMAAKLAAAGISTTRALVRVETWNLERMLSRNPPFGVGMAAVMKHFPLLTLRVSQADAVDADGVGRTGEMVVLRAVLGLENEVVPRWKATRGKVVFWAEGKSDGRLLFFWRGGVAKLGAEGGWEVLFGVEGARGGDEVVCYCASEEVVGTVVMDHVTVV